MQKHLTAREREMHSSSKKSHQYGMKSQPRGTSKRMNDTTGYESNPGPKLPEEFSIDLVW